MGAIRRGQALAWCTPAEMPSAFQAPVHALACHILLILSMQPHAHGLEWYYFRPVDGPDLVGLQMLARSFCCKRHLE